MRAKITGVRSGSEFTDKQRRVRVRFEDASFAYNELEVRESALGLMRVELDMELEVEFELALDLSRVEQCRENG